MKNRSGRDVGGALEWWEYGNPEDVLERRQSERCVGCAHAVEKLDPFGGARMVCRKGKKYGKRCGQFKETT
ncbi:hypothetical protein [Caballeronia sordidicola]|uniref:Uncharacterized protein n=1 Tax=Caballeronia sordidicola TaxID=196367 RepID=A0A242N709_CABSO|nr:hypothetical protein [Caballeronia sordidicola]OTP79470.1 hypothetical protein PAMC26577_00985 [Caballeronia sordidicola]